MHSLFKITENIKRKILFCLIAITYILGAFVELIEVDSAQYASISMEMIQTNKYLQVFEAGNDYLDKPPLLFWLGALFFKIFGINTFAFKLPVLLLSIVTIFYVFRLGNYLFNKEIGTISALILSTFLGYFWINSDVKTDILVINFILISVFHLIRFIDHNKYWDLTLGGICVGLAMLSKGPMGLIFPGIFSFFYVATTKNWKSILHLSWISFPLIILIVLAPMIYGLYLQFDMQPEKLIHGENNVSGIKFFFWDQSFGRIAGTNVYKNDTSFFYLFHCLLLLILPYTLIIFRSIWDWIKNFSFFNNRATALILSTTTIMLALSFSSYKIPHYASVAFPFCSIVIANTLIYLKENNKEKILRIYSIFLTGLSFLLCGLLFYCFTPNFVSIFLLSTCAILLIFFLRDKDYIFSLASIGVFMGLLFFSHLIPSMHNYTVGKRFKNLVTQNSLDGKEIFFVNRDSRSMEFYLQKRSQRLLWQEVLDHTKKENSLYYMEEAAITAFKNDGLSIKNTYCLDVYDINRISPKFINPNTRQKQLERHCLVEFVTE